MRILQRLLPLAFLVAPLAAQQGPWAQVPALPTSCYADDTTFITTVRNNKATLDKEIHRQDSVNESIAHSESADPGAKQAAMQAAMMKDPQGAMKLLEAIGQLGSQESNDEHMRLLKKDEQIRGQFPPMQSAYKAAYKTATDPIWKDWGQFYGGEGGKTPTAADIAASVKKFEDADAPLCTQYFKAGGTFPKYLTSYRTFLTTESIPYDQKTDSISKAMYAFYGTNTTNYKSLTAMRAVSSYLGEVYNAYVLRPTKWMPK